MPNFNSTLTLSTTAEAYLTLGWSVIPVNTDPQNAKVPALNWKHYQTHRADAADVARWFAVHEFPGLGIVTGAISGLIVLDFDDPAVQAQFTRQYPDLVATRTVQSRRGQHFYYRTQPYHRIPSHKIDGADLLSNGRYVVAPPTVIDGHEYKLVRGGSPRLLTNNDVANILSFFETPKSVEIARTVSTPLEQPPGMMTAESSIKRDLPASEAVSEPFCEPTWQPDADDLVRIYRSLAPDLKRNVALFQTSCLARDCGLSLDDVLEPLAHAHASQPPTGQHRPERYEQRYREGRRTIQSAFSRSPRRTVRRHPNLFNSIRERLFNLKQTFTVRTLEGLRLKGVQPGQTFSRQQAVDLLQGIVGRDSVDHALNAVAGEGGFIFERAVPSPRPPTPVGTAAYGHENQQKTAFCGETKSGKIESGRKNHQFVMPSNRQLCTLLGIEASVTDPLTLDDLSSAKLTRQAAHREKIKRKPGNYSIDLLRRRLGVSRTTVQRYNRDIPNLHVEPTFHARDITWATLNLLPPEEWVEPKMFLADEWGRRYKPVIGVARKLLAQGRRLKYLVQGTNYYWYGEGTRPAEQTARHFQVTYQQPPTEPDVRLPSSLNQGVARITRYIEVKSPPVVAEAPAPAKTTPAFVTMAQPDTPPKPPKYRQPNRKFADPALEQLAERIYETVNRMTTVEAERINKTTARQWIQRYGVKGVKQALATMQKRNNIYKPAGFMATVLRSTARWGQAG